MSAYRSSTRYVPLMVQHDDICYIPKIRRQKIPKIYPLVAAPTVNFCNYCACPSGSDSTNPVSAKESPLRHTRWKVVQVSRADRDFSESDAKLDHSTEHQPEELSELKAIHLFMELPTTINEKEVAQSRRKLLRISHRKLCPCDKLHPMLRITEDEETIFCSKKKQVQLNVSM